VGDGPWSTWPPASRTRRISSPGGNFSSRMASGEAFRNEEIASQLKISQETVKSHRNNIFRELRLDGRVALALLSQERGVKPKT
jgi:hypothetical protein